MDTSVDDVLLEYLAGRLRGARSQRADSLLTPKPPAPAPEVDPSDADMSELEALLTSELAGDAGTKAAVMPMPTPSLEVEIDGGTEDDDEETE